MISKWHDSVYIETLKVQDWCIFVPPYFSHVDNTLPKLANLDCYKHIWIRYHWQLLVGDLAFFICLFQCTICPNVNTFDAVLFVITYYTVIFVTCLWVYVVCVSLLMLRAFGCWLIYAHSQFQFDHRAGNMNCTVPNVRSTLMLVHSWDAIPNPD